MDLRTTTWARTAPPSTAKPQAKPSEAAMPGPMRLLWMTEHYHPGAGGMAQSCDRIVHGLRRSGIAIDVAYLVAADSGIYVRAVERAGGRDIQVAAGGTRSSRSESLICST